MNDIEVHSLLPHGPGISFLRRVVSHSDTEIECEVCPGEQERAFARDGEVPVALAIEYMAQAIAAFVSLRNGADRRPGVIIAVRGFEADIARLEFGRQLTVRVEHAWGETDVARFVGVLLDGDRRVVRAALSVYRPEPALRSP